jgi:hypothetical protein
MKTKSFVAMTAAASLFLGCSLLGLGGDGGSPGGPDTTSIVGRWDSTSVSAQSTLVTQVLSINADGTFVSGRLGSSGASQYDVSTDMGTWSLSGSTYSFDVYVLTSSASAAKLHYSGSIASGVLTISSNSFGIPETVTYNKVAAPANDVAMGQWVMVPALSSGAVPVSQTISIQDDGTVLAGQVSTTGTPGQYSADVALGTWSKSGASYPVQMYALAAQDSPALMSLSGSISGSSFTITGTINGGPVTIVYSKTTAPASAAPVGKWLFTSGTAGYAPVDQTLSVRADGTLMVGQVNTDSTVYSAETNLGTWSTAASGWNVVVYSLPSQASSTPMAFTAALPSSNTLTISGSFGATAVQFDYAKVQ